MFSKSGGSPFSETFETLETLKLYSPIAIPVPAPRGSGRIEHLKLNVSKFQTFQGFSDALKP